MREFGAGQLMKRHVIVRAPSIIVPAPFRHVTGPSIDSGLNAPAAKISGAVKLRPRFCVTKKKIKKIKWNPQCLKLFKWVDCVNRVGNSDLARNLWSR
jgi:hypothetical protein